MGCEDFRKKSNDSVDLAEKLQTGIESNQTARRFVIAIRRSSGIEHRDVQSPLFVEGKRRGSIKTEDFLWLDFVPFEDQFKQTTL